MHQDKINNVKQLSPQERYGYLIRKVADSEEVWLIHENGKYVTLGDSSEDVSIPVWPEKEFAELMLNDYWKDYSTECLDVHDFIDWLDDLEGGIKIAGFPMDNLNAVVVTSDEMKNHLLYELQRYE